MGWSSIAFGDFGQISIEVDEEVIKNLAKYLQAFLLKMQKDVIDKLFEIGEDKQAHKMKPVSKAVEEYEEHFVYEREELP